MTMAYALVPALYMAELLSAVVCLPVHLAAERPHTAECFTHSVVQGCLLYVWREWLAPACCFLRAYPTCKVRHKQKLQEKRLRHQHGVKRRLKQQHVCGRFFSDGVHVSVSLDC